jgi:RNA polymerase sigma factor (sigma-70 family)
MKNEEKRATGLGRHPEARLFEQAQGGCRDSLDLLMARHEPLVWYIANRQNLGDLPLEEAAQAGRIGLWQAILGFDPQRGYQFSTYAYKAIVHQIWAAVKTHCEANQRAHAIQEWTLLFPLWDSGPLQQQAARERQVCLQAMVRG